MGISCHACLGEDQVTGGDPRLHGGSGQVASAEWLPGPEPASGSRTAAGGKALPQILYIAGLHRSGSTVLGIVLGGTPDAIFVGALVFFWRRFAEGGLCSCGQPLPECPFWSAVIQKAFGQMTRERAVELSSLERAVFARQWPLVLAPLQWPARRSRRIGVMLAERARLYRAIGEVANAACVVDSSKDVRYGGIVARMEGAGFSIIHIVRDPRGVAFSWHKRDPRGSRSHSPPRDLFRRSALSPAVWWVRQNLIVQFLLRRLGDAYVRVRYEDLAQHPAEVRKAVADATSVTRRDGHPPAAAALTEGEHHWVGGNRRVVRRLGEGLQLTLDEQWRTGMSRRPRWLVTGACSALMAVYDYPLSSSSPRTEFLGGSRASKAGNGGQEPRA